MRRKAVWMLLCTIGAMLAPGRVTAQGETAWDALVHEDPSVAEEGVTPRLERQILQRLTPEQVERFAAGEDPSTIQLADGEDLGSAIADGFGGGGAVYVPVDACKLTGAGVPPGDLYPLGDSVISVRGTCDVPTEAVGLIVNVKMRNPRSAGRLNLFPADGGQFNPGFLNFVATPPGTFDNFYNNAVVVELCEGACAAGDLVVRLLGTTTDNKVHLHAMGYLAPDGDADSANELNESLALVGTDLEVSDAGATLSADLSSLVDDADADPANELNTTVALVGTELQVTDAGGTLAEDLGSLVDDADADPSNELNASVALVGTELQVTDAGGTKSAELGGLTDADPDPTNELNTSVVLSGTELQVTDPGGTQSADLADLEESAEIDDDIAAHAALADAHREHASLEESAEITGGIAIHAALADAHREHASLEESGEIDAKVAAHNPDPPCFDATRRFADCGNGTVTDTATGLIYLKRANCFGLQNWVTANNTAATLADGQCDLTDGSVAGDWRLQTRAEWQKIFQPACPLAPKIVGNQTFIVLGCYNNPFDPDSEWATGLSPIGYWSSETSTINDFTKAWQAGLAAGADGTLVKTSAQSVWPVRGGR